MKLEERTVGTPCTFAGWQPCLPSAMSFVIGYFAFKTRLTANFLINIFALSLALKQGLEATREWRIGFVGRFCSTEVINKKRFDSPWYRCVVFFFF